jgi:hypothetical protein
VDNCINVLNFLGVGLHSETVTLDKRDIPVLGGVQMDFCSLRRIASAHSVNCCFLLGCRNHSSDVTSYITCGPGN